MLVCANCGKESEEGFAFCPYCAAPFAPSADREQRKTVTVLFCDVVGSTALGESVDAEAARALLALFFERTKKIVEAHGGVVDKFIGDAVMAVFGVPVVHEDDALRAVRAAVEMREALPELGLQARIGVNSGEVVTGTAERLVTGDAVNVAARLEQAADAGAVLLGEGTLQLVKNAVEVAAVGPLELKGKSAPVAAWQLLAVRAPPERRSPAPMVGRETELARLDAALGQAAQDRSCQLFTILGSAGVGKSRLVAEFLAGLGARVVRGHCLSYGEGITYWPVVEVIKQLGSRPADEAAATAIGSLLGESATGTRTDMIAWAFRKLLEQEAQEQPLVVVFDDLQWGEGAFLDLVEHVADLSRDAPIFLLCMSRPELLELRPGWGGGKWNATAALLEPLDQAESARLLDELCGVHGDGLEGEARERICAAAEGNPLFLEEMLALVRESDGAELAVPATIQALLAARLDQLDPAERSVLERGAVEGRLFHQSAVQALGDGQAELAARLVALVRKDLIRPQRGQLPGEDAYLFRHQLIRDAAYDALPKSVRAKLHERFAGWLAERGSDLVELDEILGYHLEQAARYNAELGRFDTELAERAGELLAVAGRRSLWRVDRRAAASLLERALTLTRPTRLQVTLELDLANAYRGTDPQQAAAVAEAAAERAQAAGDVAGEAAARIVAANNRLEFASDPAVDELEALARYALPLLEERADHDALVHVWQALAQIANERGRCVEWAQAEQQALDHARQAGHELTYLGRLPIALTSGPLPADDALRELAALPSGVSAVLLDLHRAWLLAMLARFPEAQAIASEASEQWREIPGNGYRYAVLAELATLSGDHETAVHHLRSYCDELEEYGQRGLLSTYAPLLGRSLCALDRHDEAETLAQLGRELGGETDRLTQMLWRQVQALVDARRARHADAELLAREAVAIAEQTDMLNTQGDALCDLAQVLQAAGRNDEAGATFEQAAERYERKKNLAKAAQVSELLATLRRDAAKVSESFPSGRVG